MDPMPMVDGKVMTRSEIAAVSILHEANKEFRKMEMGTRQMAEIIRREIPGCDSKPDDWTREDMYSMAYKRAQAITHGTDVKLTVNELDRLFAQLKRSGDDL